MNRLLFLLCLLLLLPAQLLRAGEAEVQGRLLSPVTATGGAPTLTLGLDIRLAPGWHVYWRSPGEAGLPAEIDWTGSGNLQDATLAWPAPERMTSQGMESFGYHNHVVLPIRARLADTTRPLVLKGTLNLLACNQLCIPFTFDLDLTIPTGQAHESEWAALIAEWEDRVPGPPVAGFDVTSAAVTGRKLTVTVQADPPLLQPELIVENEAGYVFPAARLTGPDTLVTELPATTRLDKPLDGTELTLTLTLTDGERRLEKKITAAASPPLVPTHSLPAALLIAFIGGFILNLMPCVLPVLSLKLLTIVSHGGAPLRHIRLSFLASAAGILASFLALAAMAISLKAAGVAFGWGVQFQHPAFIVPMALILTLFAASLWNLIHIPLPRFLADAINDRLPGPGEHDHTLLGNFLTGAFATILATPCSAPFVGTALGFALAGTTLDILLVAIAMGTGLALPYLLIAAFPALARRMPRPGRWMNALRAVFGLALLLTALWLASVLTPQLGTTQAALAGGSVLLLIVALWIRASFQRPVLFLKGLLAAIVLVGIAAYWPTTQPAAALPWLPFEESAIPGLVAQGKTVLVDVTADWCLTCRANKRFVLEAEPVRPLLTAPDIILMKADWTNPSDTISAYLKKFGRYGIPFNVVYGPKAPAGIPLPELLTAGRVTEALRQANKPVQTDP